MGDFRWSISSYDYDIRYGRSLLRKKRAGEIDEPIAKSNAKRANNVERERNGKFVERARQSENC